MSKKKKEKKIKDWEEEAEKAKCKLISYKVCDDLLPFITVDCRLVYMFARSIESCSIVPTAAS